MDYRLIGSKPTPGQKITQLHAWVATYRDGSEGIIAAEMPGVGMCPLISSRLAPVEAMERVAREVQRRSLDTQHPVINVRIVSFVTNPGREP